MPTIGASDARELFGRLTALAPEERDAVLRGVRIHNPALAEEVASLLKAAELAGPFLAGAAGTTLGATSPTAWPEEAQCAAAAARGPGSVVGRYTIEERLGEGGFGVVFSAREAFPVQNRVAIKIIKPGMDSAAVVARFDQERHALARMDHPNIARVLDAGTTDAGRPYFVMELVDGPTITDYCTRHQLSTPQRLALFVDVCRAVQHAHTKGVIHRDIKPSNVLVAEIDGVAVPKVIDFGVAKALDGRGLCQTIFTEFRALIGTPEYMSPEQANPGGAGIDTRTDIYALGVLLYEMLTGTTPHTAAELRAAAWDEMQRILRDVDPPKPSTRVSERPTTGSGAGGRHRIETTRLSRILRGELDWITMKSLEKDRTRRYATADALAADVERYLRHEPVAAGPPSAWYRFTKVCRRNRAVVAAGAAVALALLAGVAVAAAGWRDAARQRDEKTIALVAEQAALSAEQAARAAAAAAAEESDRLRGLAERSAARYAAVNEMFLERLFRAFNPEGNKGRDITIAEYIDRMADLAERGDDPFVSAVIQARVGEMRVWQGRDAEAIVHLDAALAGFEAAGEADSPDAARTLLSHARARHRLGGLDPDDPRLLRAIALLSEHHGESSHRALDAREARCAALYTVGRDAEGAALNAELLEACEDLPDDRDARVQRIDLSLQYGSFLSRSGRPAEAAGLMKRTPLREDRFTEVRLATCLSLLGDYLSLTGQFDEAQQALDEALSLNERLHGADSIRCAYTLRRLAVLHMQRKEPAKGLPAAEKAVAIYAARSGENHRDTASARGSLGCLFALQQGRFTDALAEFEKAAAVDTALQPPVPDSAVASLGLLGACLTELERYDDAQAALERAIRWPYPGPAGDWCRALNLRRMVDLQRRRGDDAAAARWQAELDRAAAHGPPP